MIYLKAGIKVQLEQSKETFIIDSVYDDGTVDMTAMTPFMPERGPNTYQKYAEIRLKNYKIIAE